MSRICKICKTEKPLESFVKNKYSKGGCRLICKDPCLKESNHKHYLKIKPIWYERGYYTKKKKELGLKNITIPENISLEDLIELYHKHISSIETK